MNNFYIDLGQLNETIEGYEALLTSLETCNSSLVAATDTIDEEAYSGDDAEVLRNNWNNQFSVTLPYSINTIKEVQAAFCDAREEFAACRKFSMDMQNIFGVSSYAPSSEDGGILKCDYDALSQSVNYSNELTTECMDVKNKLTRVNSSLDSIHESCAEIYDCLDVVKVDISQLDVIEPHKFDLISYAEKVAAADSHLDTKFKSVLMDASDSGLLAPDMSVGTLTLDPYTDIDWATDEDDIEAQIQALEAKKKEYEELMLEHQTSLTLLEFYNDQILQVNDELRLLQVYKQILTLYNEKKKYEELLTGQVDGTLEGFYYQELNRVNGEIRDIDEDTLDELSLILLNKCDRSLQFTHTYDYICSLDYSPEEKVDILFHWKSIDGLDDYEIRGKEMPESWMDTHLTIPDELTVNEGNVSTYNEVYNGMSKGDALKEFYLQNHYICDSISGMGNQSYNGAYVSSERLASGEIARDTAYFLWYDYMYGDMKEYVEGANTVRSLKYAIDKQICSDVLNTNIGIYSVNDNYESMTLNYAVNLCTNNEYRDYVDNHQTTFVVNTILEEMRINPDISEQEKEIRKTAIENIHEKVLNSNYVILWSYSGDRDVKPFETHYNEEYSFLNGDGNTDDWTEEVWIRFEEESAFSRAAQTRRDDLVYFEGISCDQIIFQRIDAGRYDSSSSLCLFWEENVGTLENVGTIDIYSHGGGGSPEMYHTSFFTHDWYFDGSNNVLDVPDWTDDMEIGPRLTFHGCETAKLENDETQKIANYQGVPVQGNLYYSSFSENMLYHNSIKNFEAYKREESIYQYTYKNITNLCPSIIPVNTTTFYPEEE